MNAAAIAMRLSASPPPLTDLDLTNIRSGMSPAVLEMIGTIFLESAARLRANGYTGREARA